MTTLRKLTRRAFLASVGLTGIAAGGLILTGKHTGLQNRLHQQFHKPPEKLHLFIQIGTDNRVTLVCHRVEMGQGVRTSLPMILADELEADWSLVDVVQAPGDAAYGNQYTAGSRSVFMGYELLRQLGATARTMLEQAAASVWSVSADECVARGHRVEHAASGRSLSYGELAELAAKLPIPPVSQVRLKNPAEFRYIGKAIPSVDSTDIVQGQAQYTSDITLPDMLYAVVEHAPVIGARLQSLDDSAARKVPGVVDVLVLPVQDFPMAFKPLHGVAAVATSSWAALQGRKQLRCTWSDSQYSNRGSDQLQADLVERIKTPGEVLRRQGDPDAALASAAQVIDATYLQPYLAHAPMEPPVAVADVRWNSCRLWVSSQDPQNVRHEIASLLNIPLHNVEINVPLLGGGFGRKAKGDFCAQAALIAAHMGVPVKLFWSREDDIRFGYYHAMSVMHLRAGLDADKRITSWILRAAYPSIQSLYTLGANKPSRGEIDLGANGCLFTIPNTQAEVHSADEAARIGWFRSVASIQYGFAHNCFADEIASARGLDPFANLLSLIGDDRIIDPAELQMDYPHQQQHPIDTARFKRVLRRVVESSGYHAREANTGWGLAVHFTFPTSTAAATKVRIDGKRLIVEEVHVAIDCGQVVNMDSVKAQLEGSVIFALAFALSGRIDILQGQVQQTNFHDYPLLRINQCPKIFTYVEESHLPPSGVGEPAVPVIAPSLANAIHAATGKRFRQLPLNAYFEV